MLGLGVRPIPCDDAKGLLPGRGPAGFAVPIPCDGAKGLFPGRAAPAGFGGSGLSAAGFSAAGFSAAGFAAASPASTAVSAAAAGALTSAGVWTPASGAAAFSAAGFVAAFAGAFAAAGFSGAGSGFLTTPSASRAARSLRATGGAMLDAEDLTNSPSSCSFARATLLSTPSSAAISCTRGFATILLSRVHAQDRREPLLVDGSHFEPLIFCPLAVQPVLSSGWFQVHPKPATHGENFSVQSPSPNMSDPGEAMRLSLAGLAVHRIQVDVHAVPHARECRDDRSLCIQHTFGQVSSYQLLS